MRGHSLAAPQAVAPANTPVGYPTAAAHQSIVALRAAAETAAEPPT